MEWHLMSQMYIEFKSNPYMTDILDCLHASVAIADHTLTGFLKGCVIWAGCLAGWVQGFMSDGLAGNPMA
jgi:hypothetical protein